MKRCFFIISLIIAVSFNTLFSFDNGLYLAPKFIFNMDDTRKKNDKNENIINKYIGGGLAFGYDFYKSPLLVPVRLDLEYVYREGMAGNYYTDSSLVRINTHTLLASVYYSFHIFYIDKNNLSTLTADDIYTMRPVTSFYLGLLLGGKFNDHVSDRWYEDGGNISVTKIETKPTFAIGLGTGFDFQLSSYLNLDIGYRLLYGLDNVLSHEIAVAFRVKFPKLWDQENL